MNDLNKIKEHTLDDGLGCRVVYDRGFEVKNCVYVNMERGFYHVIPDDAKPVLTLIGETHEVERIYSNDIRVDFVK